MSGQGYLARLLKAIDWIGRSVATRGWIGSFVNGQQTVRLITGQPGYCILTATRHAGAPEKVCPIGPNQRCRAQLAWEVRDQKQVCGTVPELCRRPDGSPSRTQVSLLPTNIPPLSIHIHLSFSPTSCLPCTRTNSYCFHESAMWPAAVSQMRFEAALPVRARCGSGEGGVWGIICAFGLCFWRCG